MTLYVLEEVTLDGNAVIGVYDSVEGARAAAKDSGESHLLVTEVELNASDGGGAQWETTDGAEWKRA